MVAREVQHLQVRAGSQADARQGVARLQEALRCASLPDADQRLLLVRHLALGTLPPGASAQGLTRWVDHAVQAAGWQWVDAHRPEAAQAPAVVFANSLEAACQLSRRLLVGPAPVEWFWPLTLPGFHAAQPKATALWQLAQRLAQGPQGAVAVQQWAAQLRRWQLGPALTQVLTQAQGEALVRHAGGPWAVGQAGSCAWVERLAGAGLKVGQSSPQPGSAAAAEGSSRPLVPPETTALAPQASLAAVLASPASPAPSVEPRRVRPAGRVAKPRPPGPQPPSTLQRAPPPVASNGLGPSHPASAPAVATTQAGLPAHAEVPNVFLAPSARAGLFFLLVVWQRLGLLERASQRRVQQALWWALRGTRAPGADPLLALARPPRPLARRDRARASRWRRLANQWLRQHAGMGVAALVCRPGQVQVSATHVDVHFGLAQADLRLRRLGVDVSPGWLPTWRRVLAFHFEAEGR